jgi:hypothetical protein|nr:MAG TPA: PcfJ like protein [Caudoviricetes sp.]
MEYIYRNIENIPVDIEYPDDFEKTVTNTLCKPIIYNRFKKIAHCPKFGETFEYMDTIRKGDSVPYRGENRVAMPHTCHPVLCGQTYVWMFYREETIYFVEAYASWRYDGEEVADMRDVTQIYIERIVCISREEQFMYAYQGAYRGEWSRCQDGSIYLIDKGYVHNLVTIEQLQNTFLKYMDIHVRCADYMIKEAAVCAKYPQVEFIKKAGLEEIVKRKVVRVPAYIRPNWKAKSITKFLGITHQDVEKLKSWGMFNLENIATYKILASQGKVKKNHIELVKREFYLSELYEDRNTENFVRLATYFEKQRKRMKEDSNCINHSIKWMYKDYLKQLQELEYPVNDYYRYPKNLREAHDRISEEYLAMQNKKRQEADKERQEKFEKEFLPRLEKMCWRDSKYLIRPLRNRAEYNNEGRNNHNCVASYYERATEGGTSIFVLRKIGAEEQSFVTVEIDLKRGELKQCYGQGNRLPEKEVTEWVEKWIVKMIKKLRKADKATLKGAA